jgi:hypothetical protein
MSRVLYNERGQTCFVVVLQDCVLFVEGETGSCNETGVECDFGGNEKPGIEGEEALHIKEEVFIKVEDPIEIKDEIQEDTSPTIKTEDEVRLCGVCELVAAQAFRPFIAPKSK